jgi:hypothetical protein
MQYLGSSFALVLGAWRLRVQFALEDAVEERPASNRAAEWAAPHHLMAVGDPTPGRSGRAPRP